ncbi:TIGR00270 family protein [Candidatus Woesearchaeota archaeon]|jgi:putative transcription factor|nr:TIGR00270 family protein [Candidatus Woesearchaeota archaeon]|tara:strand:+ start:2071 stop:2526 length:456 start_codon:yes stop_codon:yes gene_type:complete
MKCDMCGSNGKLYKAIIEDAELGVCHECSKFGKVVGVINQNEDDKSAIKAGKELQIEIMEMVVEDYSDKIRKKRESLGLKQEEFAKRINEKESLIQKIESGHFEPSIALAKKIGKFLRIKLTEEHEERHEKQAHSKTDSFTIGDIIKTKKK